MFRNSNAAYVVWALLLAGANLSQAQHAAPQGVYAKIYIEDAIDSYKGNPANLHGHLQKLYKDLLKNPAISGISVGFHWDLVSLSKKNPSVLGPVHVFGGYDWSWLEDVFQSVGSGQTVQLLITPGFDTPQWVLDELQPCDPFFTMGSDETGCGEATFTGFKESQRADGTVLPLPWNDVYQQAWLGFLVDLRDQWFYNYPSWVAIALTGPIAASNEMILSTLETDTTKQLGGLDVETYWNDLLSLDFKVSHPGYLGNNEALIKHWNQVIDGYETIFPGLTMIVSPDAGNYWPYQEDPAQPHADNTVYTNLQDCSRNASVSCEAKTDILSHLVAAQGANGKATRVGGMTASTDTNPGDIGITGVKLLTSAYPGILGGAEFNHPVSGRHHRQEVGCPSTAEDCTLIDLTPEAAAYNVLAVFFDQTEAYPYYSEVLAGSTSHKQPLSSGSRTIQYLEVPFLDVEYATENPCPPVPRNPTLGKRSLQDLLNHASYDFIVMNDPHLFPQLPPATCP